MTTLPKTGMVPSIAISTFLVIAGFWIPFLHLYLLNVANLTMPLSVHLPGLAALSAVVVGLSLAIQRLTPIRYRTVSSSLLFVAGIFLWAESTLFIGNYGFFQGGDLDWQGNRHIFYLEILLIAILAVLAIRLKRRLPENAVLITCLLTLSSAANLYPPFKANLSRTTVPIHHTFNQEGVLQLSSDRNVLLFIIDTLQSDVLAEILAENPHWKDVLDGFVYFPDATSAFPKTYASIPNILTGRSFDNSEPFPVFLREAYLDNSAPKVLKQNGFDVRYRSFTFQPYFPHPEVADNLSVIGSSIGVQWMQRHELVQLCNLVLFRLSPWPVKKRVYNDGEFLIRASSIPRDEDEAPYRLEASQRVFSKGNNVKDMEFLDQMMAFLSTEAQKPAFRVFHFRGVHTPFVLDSDLNFIGSQPIRRDVFRSQAEGMLKLLSLVFDRLKQMEAWDNSLIFVLGDHGAGDYSSIGVRRRAIQDLGLDIQYAALPDSAEAKPIRGGLPAVLVKPAGRRGAMEISTSPVELADIPNTIFHELGYAKAATGPSMFDGSALEGRDRYFRYYFFAGWGQDYIVPLTEYVVSGFSWDDASWSLSGRDMNRQAARSLEGNLVVLGQGGNMGDFLHEGWGDPLAQGRHISGGTASVEMSVDTESGNLGMNLKINPLRSPRKSVQLSAFVNEQFVASWPIDRTTPDRLWALIPQSVHRGASDLHLHFELADPGSDGPLIIEIRLVPDQETRLYSAGEAILFHEGGNLAEYIGSGWSDPEDWGAWTLGERARLYLALESVFEGPLELELELRPAVYRRSRPLRVDVMVNGEIIRRWSFDQGSWQTRTLQLPESLMAGSQVLDLSFAIRNPRPPSADKSSGDTRRVGLGLKRLVLRGVPAAGPGGVTE